MRGLHEKFMVEERLMSASQLRSWRILSVTLMIVGSVGFVGILLDVVWHGELSSIDRPFTDLLDRYKSETLTAVMIGLAIVFGPVALPIVILVVIVAWGILAKHAWRPLLLAVGTLTGVIIVQIMTRVIGRSRPPEELMMFGPDSTFSFPSGHVLGAADFLLLLTYLIFSRRTNPVGTTVAFIVATILIVIAGVSRIYLGYHWATDALASMSLSLVILGAVMALDTHRTARVAPQSLANRARAKQ